MNKSRLEGFSDAMFAIIITIMILEIKAPHGKTFKDFFTQLPVVFSYLQSFWFVANYWTNHHHLLHIAKKITPSILVANLNLLFFISLIPFVTSWVSEANFSTEPVIVYAIALIIPCLAWYMLGRLIEKHNSWSEQTKKIMKRQKRKGFISVIIYVVAIPSALINTYISEVLFLIVALMWIIPEKVVIEFSVD